MPRHKLPTDDRTDVLTPEQRHYVMARIKGRNTKPERIIRSALHAAGYRFRLSPEGIPGTPDLVLPRYRAVIFIHGCFWHGHTCHLFKWPQTNPEFWKQKIEGNRRRDRQAVNELMDAGWRVLFVWECAIRGVGRMPVPEVMNKISKWLQGEDKTGEIAGRTANL